MSPNALLPHAPPSAPAAVPQYPRRRRRSLRYGIAILMLLVASAITALVVLLQHEPTFYRRAAVPPGSVRRSFCVAFAAGALALKNNINMQSNWSQEFSEEQINSFFQEDLLNPESLKKLSDEGIKFNLPDHVTDPRIAFDEDRIRVGFRYHIGRFSTIVSIAMRVWIPQGEPNVMAVEIQGMRAGALPISAQSILERLSEAAESNNIKLSWYRHEGNPVAVLHFQSDSRNRVKLDNFDAHPSKLFIKGTPL